jgi:hypothetical protein
MVKTVCALVPDISINEQWEFIEILDKSKLVESIVVYSGMDFKNQGSKFRHLSKAGLHPVSNFRNLAKECEQDYFLICNEKNKLTPVSFFLERLISIAESTNAGIVYGDYYEIIEDKKKAHPLIEYQEGSLRDDFNFGPLLLISSTAFKQAVSRMEQDVEMAGLYYLRLKISQNFPIIHIPEYLSTVGEFDEKRTSHKFLDYVDMINKEILPDSKKTSPNMFDYVDPKNRELQIEMEKVHTEHLKDIGAYLEPVFKPVVFDESGFKVKASVIIPVKNRMKTIEDAVLSVFKQKTNFKFNLIVVDNYSTDGTSQILEFIASTDSRLIHYSPANPDLGIGGCWNEAIHHPNCGMFAVQLDSDDVYKDENTLQKIVDEFYKQKCAMIVGSYQLVNFKYDEIPPGLIDHKEWTPENGRNNALRINGLGAPRAFYVPVLREINFPNVSYGEDYAVGLAISRNYQIGRIYESIYLCRRWDDNTDAMLDIEKQNAHNRYKDRIRTLELKARQVMNSNIV